MTVHRQERAEEPRVPAVLHQLDKLDKLEVKLWILASSKCRLKLGGLWWTSTGTF